jgi:hypothetical protein
MKQLDMQTSTDFPSVIRPTPTKIDTSSTLTYWNPYDTEAFTQQLLRNDREKSGQSKWSESRDDRLRNWSDGNGGS